MESDVGCSDAMRGAAASRRRKNGPGGQPRAWAPLALLLAVIGSSSTAEAQGAIRDTGFSGFSNCERGYCYGTIYASLDFPRPITFYGRDYSVVSANILGLLAFGVLPTNEDYLMATEQAGLAAFPPNQGPVIAALLGHMAGAFSYGPGMADGRRAWGATWLDVEHDGHDDGRRNSFQVVIIDRSDVGLGDFDIEFNFDLVEWDFSVPYGPDYTWANYHARTGISNGSNEPRQTIEIPSGTQLPSNSLNSVVLGRYVLPIRNGKGCPDPQPFRCDARHPCASLGPDSICPDPATTIDGVVTVTDETFLISPSNGWECPGFELTFDRSRHGRYRREVVETDFVCHEDCTTNCVQACGEELVHDCWLECIHPCTNGHCLGTDGNRHDDPNDPLGWVQHCVDRWDFNCEQHCWDDCSTSWNARTNTSYYDSACGYPIDDLLEIRDKLIDGTRCQGAVVEQRRATGAGAIKEKLMLTQPGVFDICVNGEFQREISIVDGCGDTVPDGSVRRDYGPSDDGSSDGPPDDGSTPRDGTTPDVDGDTPWDGDASTPDDGSTPVRQPLCSVKIPQNVWTIAEGTPDARLAFSVWANDLVPGPFTIRLVRYDADDHLPPYLDNPPFIVTTATIAAIPNARSASQLVATDPHPVNGQDVWYNLVIHADGADANGDGQADVSCEAAVTVRLRCERNADCQDGNFCTDERCDPTSRDADARGCVVTPHCQAGTGDQCIDATCNEETDTCGTTPKPFGDPCSADATNLCILRSACDGNGACVPRTFVDCRAPDECHEDGVCDPATGTCAIPVSVDGKACSDRSVCTEGDVCISGVCTPGAPITCPVDQCHPPTACDPTRGCPVAQDGTACNDGDLCTDTDACVSGACTGQVHQCTALDHCHVPGTCEPSTGCSNPPAAACCGNGILEPHGTATSLELAWLPSSACIPTALANITFSVNGVTAYTGVGVDQDCGCTPGIRTVIVTDPAVLAQLQSGPVTFTVHLDRFSLAWAVARVNGAGSQDVVIYDAPGGGDDARTRNPNVCSAGTAPQGVDRTAIETLTAITEQCDDGNLFDGDGCDASCQLERCGNHRVNPGEDCDDGNLISGDGCNASCRREDCGDGVPGGPDEECDDGNMIVGDGCDAACRVELCGNGRLDFGEACDDGNLIDGDECTNACTTPYCGDGVLSETSGAVRSIELAWLSTSCTGASSNVRFAADGVTLYSGLGAIADCSCAPQIRSVTITDPALLRGIADGTTRFTFDPGSALTAWAVAVLHGPTTQTVVLADANGGGDAERRNPDLCGATYEGGYPHEIVASLTGLSEQCDDGNTVDGDGCNAGCAIEVSPCGNGVRDAGEVCDDGNRTAGDGCSPSCTLEYCGDGVLQPQAGAVQSVDFTWLSTSCSGVPLDITFSIGGVVAYTGTGAIADCGCGPAIRTVTVTDRAVLSRIADGAVDLRVTTNALTAWAVATLHGATTTDVVIYDANGGGDAERRSGDLCGSTYTGNVDQTRQVVLSGVNETCDDGNLVPGDGCGVACNAEICGNGIVDAGEACDDGNTVDGDGCGHGCDLEYCGDGVYQPGSGAVTSIDLEWLAMSCSGQDEEITFTIGDTTAYRGLGTTADCTCMPIIRQATITDRRVLQQIHDGTVPFTVRTRAALGWAMATIHGKTTTHVFIHDQTGGVNAMAGNRWLCGLDTSGDHDHGELFAGVNEECDDGNLELGDGCTPTCEREVCGDGRITGLEACDDGNTSNDDGCSSTCRVERCGDEITQANEGCDDGNTIAGDGCSAGCTTEVCGNGIADVGEECDDGNAVSGDGCTPACHAEVCGDGVFQPGGTGVRSLELTWLAEGCSGHDELVTFLVNGVPAYVGVGAGADDCTCTPPIRSVVVRDAAVLRELHNGNVTFSFRFTDGYVAWVVATVHAAADTDVVIFDYQGGRDAEHRNPNTCNARDTWILEDYPTTATLSGLSEECDDGNTTAGDGCGPTCGVEICGNGRVDFGEQCDDGNNVALDGCEPDCTRTDRDHDRIPDIEDNCPTVANPGQEDTHQAPINVVLDTAHGLRDDLEAGTALFIRNARGGPIEATNVEFTCGYCSTAVFDEPVFGLGGDQGTICGYEWEVPRSLVQNRDVICARVISTGRKFDLQLRSFRSGSSGCVDATNGATCAATGGATSYQRLDYPDAGDACDCHADGACTAPSYCHGSDPDCPPDRCADFVATPTSCGVGACARSGLTTCTDGVIGDSCTPGTPATRDDTCDGVDDDCDGVADEDYVSVTTTCGAGVCGSHGHTTCVAGAVVDDCRLPPDGTSCADADPCNGTETCRAGACVAGTWPGTCDDGNTVDGDGCDSNCTTTACGNGIVTSGELCDDGNRIDYDGCDANCRPTPTFSVKCVPRVMELSQGSTGQAVCTITALNGFTGNVTLGCAHLPTGVRCQFTPITVNVTGATGTANLGVIVASDAPLAMTTYDVTATGPHTSASTTNTISITGCATPVTPVLTAPANGATGVSTTPTLSWGAVSGATSYSVVVATDSAFTNVVRFGTPTGTSFAISPALVNGATYWWRVAASAACGVHSAYAVGSFTPGSGTTTNRVANAGFESGSASWTTTGNAVITNLAANPPHTGSYYAQLGGTTGSSASITQNVVIPADATAAHVELWVRTVSAEAGQTCRDTMTVTLREPLTQALLGTVATVCNWSAQPGWRQVGVFDATPFRGRTVSLGLTAVNDAQSPTTFYVDDVVLAADGR